MDGKVLILPRKSMCKEFKQFRNQDVKTKLSRRTSLLYVYLSHSPIFNFKTSSLAATKNFHYCTSLVDTRGRDKEEGMMESWEDIRRLLQKRAYNCTAAMRVELELLAGASEDAHIRERILVYQMCICTTLQLFRTMKLLSPIAARSGSRNNKNHKMIANIVGRNFASLSSAKRQQLAEKLG